MGRFRGRGEMGAEFGEMEKKTGKSGEDGGGEGIVIEP